MSTTMLLYKEVTPLSRDAHKALKFKPSDKADFASHTHWLPVAGAEFYQASQHFPIVFIRDTADAPVSPVLVLGFEAGHNNYVSGDGRWLADCYLPAFVRRYPFVLAESNKGGEDAMICFDSACPGMNESEGEPLFLEDGSNSPFLDGVIQFMESYRAEMIRTREFISLLEQFDLFKETAIDIQSSSGATLKLENILVIDEDKLAKLFGSQLAQLNRAGFLGWIFAHLISLSKLPVVLGMQSSGNKQSENNNSDK